MQSIELAAAGMEISIATLMLLFGGFLLAGRGQKTVPAYALAAITGLIGIQMLLSTFGAHESWQWLRNIKPPLALLIVPAAFIYISQVRQDSVAISAGTLLHAIPALGVTILIAVHAGPVIDTYLNVCIAAYWVASLVSFLRHRPAYKPATVERFVLWLIIFFGIVLLLDVILSYQAQSIGNYRELPTYIVGLAAMLIGAARMMWTALQNPQLLAEPASGIKYSRAGLDVEGLASLSHRFDTLMSADKTYMNDDISLAQVAANLDAQPRHLSQMVNTRFGQNFSAYINTLRVQEAAARLCCEAHAGTPITTIMYDTGFSSKSVFNREFRRQFECSPKEYRERSLIGK